MTTRHHANVEADIAFLEENKIVNCLDCTPSIITVHEVDEAICALKMRKAPDLNGISSEHLIYAKEILIQPLCTLFNSMLEISYIPDAFLTGYIIPIWRKKGSMDDPSKYQSITVSLTVGKVFEDILPRS